MYYYWIIAMGIIAQVILFIFCDKKIASYGSVLFWSIGLLVGVNYAINLFKLSRLVGKTKPDLYDKNSFGILIRRTALSDNKFLNTLNENELRIIAENKNLFRYFLICFILFGVSSILVVVK